MKSDFETISASLPMRLQDFSNTLERKDQLLFTEYPCRDSELHGEGITAVLTGDLLT